MIKWHGDTYSLAIAVRLATYNVLLPQNKVTPLIRTTPEVYGSADTSLMQKKIGQTSLPFEIITKKVAHGQK